MPPCPPLLKQIANDFAELQTKRHIADYNLYLKFTRQDAVRTVFLADRSINALEAARGNYPAELQAFLLALQGARKINA